MGTGRSARRRTLAAIITGTCSRRTPLSHRRGHILGLGHMALIESTRPFSLALYVRGWRLAGLPAAISPTRGTRTLSLGNRRRTAARGAAAPPSWHRLRA